MADIKLYDTVKDKKGRRYRVIEVRGKGDDMVISVRGINGDGTKKGGRPIQRGIKAFVEEFTRINLPEVTVREIDDLSEEERKMVKEPAQHENAAQIKKEVVRELSADDIKKAVEKSTVGVKEAIGKTTDAFKNASKNASDVVKTLVTDDVREKLDALDELEKPVPEPHTLQDTFEEFREKNQPNVKSVTVTVDGREILEQITHEKELDVLKAELKDKIQECIDLKKTISKMQQAHEAEVAKLNDRIMELEILAKKKNEYAYALDEDSVAFESIYDLAHIVYTTAGVMQTIAERIRKETEGRI